MKKILLSLCMVLTTFVLHAQTNYYINAISGSDGNDGTTVEKAWQTINGHSNEWNNTDCILNIADGEYIITSEINLGANTQIIGTSKDKVFLMGATDDDFGIDRYGNLPFTNCSFFNISGVQKTVTIKNITMKNIRLGSETNTSDIWGGFIKVESGCKLAMNTVDLLNGEIPIGGGTGVYSYGTLDFRNVTISDCKSSNDGPAIALSGDCIAKFTGCKFKNNKGKSSIWTNLQEVTDGICGDLSFDHCYFTNNDYSAGEYSACILMNNFTGKLLKYHITNSTFSGNVGNTAGVLFITTDIKKNRQIDLLVLNSTFINNSETKGPHGAVFNMNNDNSNTISGSISFVNNTFYHNGRTPGMPLNGGVTELFFMDNSVNFNFINNISLKGKGENCIVLNYSSDPSKHCNPTIKGNIYEGIGGDTPMTILFDEPSNLKVGQDEDVNNGIEYIDGNKQVMLDTTLIFQGDYKAPYLKIEGNSIAIDAGYTESSLIPLLDVRGQAIYNSKKDIGAYEYAGTNGVDNVNKDKIKVYLNRVAANVLLSEEVADITIYSIAGTQMKSVRNCTLVNISDFPAGLYIFKITQSNGAVFSIKLQK